MKTKLLASILAVITITILHSGCTENNRVRMFGGTSHVDIPNGEKLVNITWKNTDLWVLTRKSNPNEPRETYVFSEKSTFGIAEGKVILTEK